MLLFDESSKDGGMLEMNDNNLKDQKDKTVEQMKRNKAKLIEKLRKQESLANANVQVMVRDRRRPRKSIKEMSVLNKRRRVIKNTARKEIAQQKATLESMRHIELKRYSLEARELGLFVQRIHKVKENKRLTMLFSKFKVTIDSDAVGSDNTFEEGSNTATGYHGHGHGHSTTADNSEVEDADKGDVGETSDKKSNDMAKLIDELNSMSSIIDYDQNPQWKYIMSGNDGAKSTSVPSTPVKRESSMFGSRLKKNQALEAPAELQSIQRFPSITSDTGSTSRDDSELKTPVRRCMSQPNVNNGSRAPRGRRVTAQEPMYCMPTLYSDVEMSSRGTTAECKTRPSAAEAVIAEKKKRPTASYHTNWREREKRGDSLYSPVALSPIQSGMCSPDFVMEEDDGLIDSYKKKLNPKRFQTDVSGRSGDMEFIQALSKIPSEPKNKKVGSTGAQSIIEMQLHSKTKSITEKVQKVRSETIKERKSPRPKQGAKNIAQLIHNSGEGTRFIEEVQMLRQFAALCNCKYLRTDPDKLDERRQAYITTLMENVTKRVQIKQKWKMGMRRVTLAPTQTVKSTPVSLPIIAQGSSE